MNFTSKDFAHHKQCAFDEEICQKPLEGEAFVAWQASVGNVNQQNRKKAQAR
jgi:hypothetical protein